MSKNLIVISSLAYGPAALCSGNFSYCIFPCDAAEFKNVIAQSLGADEHLLRSMLKWPNECSREFQASQAGAQFWKVQTTRPLPKELDLRCQALRKIAAALEQTPPVLSAFVDEATSAEEILQSLTKVDGVSVRI